jgi:thymidylate synthase (FAD)
MKINIVNMSDTRGILMAALTSRNKESIENLSEKIFEWKHFGLLEHAFITLQITGISRACCDQLTRYRIGHSFVVQSQRYVDPVGLPDPVTGEFSKDWYVIPPSFREDGIDKNDFHDQMQEIAVFYHNLVHGRKPIVSIKNMEKEDARFLLPMATKTSVTWSTTMKGLFHMLHQRLSVGAQWEIRALAEEIGKMLTKTSWEPYYKAFYLASAIDKEGI